MRKLSIIYLSIILVLFFFGYLNFRLDDAYIFFTYARNIVDGNGYVFNLEEKVNATTSPLYTLVLALFYWLTKPFFEDSFVIIGNLISIFSIILIIYSIKRISNDSDKYYWFTAIFLSMPLLKFGFGMETHLNIALLVFSVYLFTKERFLLSSAFIGFAVLARLDSILYAGIIFLYYLFKYKKLPPVLSVFIFLSIISPWFIFSKLYFNSFLPTTIGAKISQPAFGLFGNGLVFLTGSVRVIPGTYLTVLTLLLIVSFSLFYLIKKKIIFLNNDGILIMIIWSSALFITYAFIINAPPYSWYYTPFAIPISILFAIVLSDLLKGSGIRKLALTGFFIAACTLPVKNLIEGYNPKYSNFINVAKWLNINVPDGSVLGVDDIGILRYHYKKGKLVDALGLINPEVSEHLSKKDFNWFLDHFKPDFIAHEYPNIQAHLRGNEKTFWMNYKVVKVYESRGQKIGIYQRISSKSLIE